MQKRLKKGWRCSDRVCKRCRKKVRNPIEVLEDLAKVFNQLEESDPLRTEILTNIGQKYQANKLSALLSGWSDYEKNACRLF